MWIQSNRNSRRNLDYEEENDMLKLKEMIGKKMTLLEMDNEILDIVGGGESIFDYDRSHWKDGGFSYLDKYNVLFDIVKDNEDPLKVLVKITEVELI